MTLRWSDYVMAHDDGPGSVEELWREGRSNHGLTLFVLGAGFDPRALVALKRLTSVIDNQRLRVISIGLRTTGADRITEGLAETNAKELEEILSKPGIDWRRMAYPRVAETSSAGLLLGRSLLSDGHLAEVTQIIVDISALPGGIYFPLVGAILRYSDEGQLEAEIQVVACDNPEVDDAIVVAGLGAPSPVGGFKHGLDLETSANDIRVWAPILGAGHADAIRILNNRLVPREICPVLPFPARRPRLADDLVLEYREVLFQTMLVEPRNFIYAHETNPFDLYRQLSRLQDRYRRALEPIGEATVVLSSHASKLLSVGALLAAYESRLPVVSAPPADYALAQGADLQSLAEQNRLALLWLGGTPYR